MRGPLLSFSIVILALASGTPQPAAARNALGVHGAWAAFRDGKPARCFAVSEPDRAISPAEPEWRPFFSIATWPDNKVEGQVHIRMSKQRKPGTPLRLTVGAARFGMISSGAEAWAPDPATDRAIIAALRTSRRATIVGRARDGTMIRDGYLLAGAATAVDAARLACARR
jgi:hypothetical protein